MNIYFKGVKFLDISRHKQSIVVKTVHCEFRFFTQMRLCPLLNIILFNLIYEATKMVNKR